MTHERLDEAPFINASFADWAFADRIDAGRYLARCLRHPRGEDVVVVGPVG
jgi:hypothetical protein